MNTNPQRTLDLIATLSPLGFPDSAFSVIAHPKHKDTIEKHRQWCLDRKNNGTKLVQGKSPSVIQRRLEIILGCVRGGEFGTSVSEEVFCHLARAAAAHVPFQGGDED